jgi:hypothetical protein
MMFPIDSNLLLGILILVAVIAYILILKKLGPRSVPAEDSSEQYSKETSQENIKKREYSIKRASETEEPKHPRSECSHHFGYLRTLPRNRALPSECLGCSKIIQCLAQESRSKSTRRHDST